MRGIRLIVIVLIALLTFPCTGCIDEIHKMVVKHQKQTKEAEAEKQKQLLQQKEIEAQKRIAEDYYQKAIKNPSNFSDVSLALNHYEELSKSVPGDKEIKKRKIELGRKYLEAKKEKLRRDADDAYRAAADTNYKDYNKLEKAISYYTQLCDMYSCSVKYQHIKKELENMMKELENELEMKREENARQEEKKKAEKARQEEKAKQEEKMRQEEKTKQLILKAKSQKSRTLVFKGLYIGMPIYETLIILKTQCKSSSYNFTIQKGRDESLYLFSGKGNGSIGLSDNKTYLTSITLNRDLIDQLFHSKGMTWDRFMQEFINSYNIPELKAERHVVPHQAIYLVDDIYSYDSPQGYQIKFVEKYFDTKLGKIDDTEYIELKKTRRVSDAKFD